jgi:hypothetical protein
MGLQDGDVPALLDNLRRTVASVPYLTLAESQLMCVAIEI